LKTVTVIAITEKDAGLRCGKKSPLIFNTTVIFYTSVIFYTPVFRKSPVFGKSPIFEIYW